MRFILWLKRPPYTVAGVDPNFVWQKGVGLARRIVALCAYPQSPGLPGSCRLRKSHQQCQERHRDDSETEFLRINAIHLSLLDPSQIGDLSRGRKNPRLHTVVDWSDAGSRLVHASECFLIGEKVAIYSVSIQYVK